MSYFTVPANKEPTVEAVIASLRCTYTLHNRQYPEAFPFGGSAQMDWESAHYDSRRNYLRAKVGDPVESLSYRGDIQHDDDVMTVAEWKESCEIGAFIDYDGFGYAVKDGKAAQDFSMLPSLQHLVPKDATHIVWYNR